MRRWLSEPLVHFLLLGALVFAWYAWVAADRPGEDEIFVSRGQQEHLVTAFARTWQRPPTQQEFTRLVDDWIREEVAYREGLKMGLDTGDTIIRRRLRQKLEMLAEDVVSLAEPTEEQLQAYLEAHQEDFIREPLYTLRQVYFSFDRRGERAVQDAEQALVLLAARDALIDPETLGDPLPLPEQFTAEREGALAAQFGLGFIEALRGLPPGVWQGPVRSGFGLHLVFIESSTPARPLTLDEAREQVLRDWANQQRVETIDRLYQRLREGYTVTIQSLGESGTAP